MASRSKMMSRRNWSLTPRSANGSNRVFTILFLNHGLEYFPRERFTPVFVKVRKQMQIEYCNGQILIFTRIATRSISSAASQDRSSFREHLVVLEAVLPFEETSSLRTLMLPSIPRSTPFSRLSLRAKTDSYSNRLPWSSPAVTHSTFPHVHNVKCPPAVTVMDGARF